MLKRVCAPSHPRRTTLVSPWRFLATMSLGLILIGLVFLAVLGIVVGRAVEEQHDVGILLDRAGVAQVGKLWPVVRAAWSSFPLRRDAWIAR